VCLNIKTFLTTLTIKKDEIPTSYSALSILEIWN